MQILILLGLILLGSLAAGTFYFVLRRRVRRNHSSFDKSKDAILDSQISEQEPSADPAKPEASAPTDITNIDEELPVEVSEGRALGERLLSDGQQQETVVAVDTSDDAKESTDTLQDPTKSGGEALANQPESIASVLQLGMRHEELVPGVSNAPEAEILIPPKVEAREINDASGIESSYEVALPDDECTPVVIQESPEDRLSTTGAGTPLTPAKRGGRSRETDTHGSRQNSIKSRRTVARPEIVCWKRSREWIFGLELSVDGLRTTEIVVLQDSVPLERYETEDNLWLLPRLDKRVVVEALGIESANELAVDLGKVDCLLFKLRGSDLSEGRLVRQSSLGSYAVIAPADWVRDEKLAGPAPVEPEQTAIDGYRVHFFDLDRNSASRVALRDQLGNQRQIDSSGPDFVLAGHIISDRSAHAGALFGLALPTLHLSNGSWSQIRTVVVGEEGAGRARWRMAFQPAADQPEQKLPDEIVNRNVGWYFLRFYDGQDELIDSLDFRFASGVHSISVRQGGFLPSEAGHGDAIVEIRHDDCFHLEPSSDECKLVEVNHSSESTILAVPPVAECDETHWLICHKGGRRVKIEISLDRVWWMVNDNDRVFSDWQDTCIFLSREDFTATSEKTIRLRFPAPRWISRVFVGFEHTKRRQYDVKVTESIAIIPLRDLSDSEEISDTVKDHSLRIWMTMRGSEYEATIATVSAEQVESLVDVSFIPAHRMATALTYLRQMARGPLRMLITDVRRQYRRLPYARKTGDVEFVKVALCVIWVYVQQNVSHHSAMPHVACRWRSRARLASQRYPEIMRQVWQHLEDLKKRN